MRRKAVLVLASLLSLIFTTTVVALTVWQAQQTISQTIEESPASGTVTQSITLPKGYKNVEGSYTEGNALTVTTQLDNMILQINQTETQRSNIASVYSKFILHVKNSATGEEVITFDMTARTYASAILPTAGTYTFDYIFEYVPASTAVVSLVITVSVTT